SGLTLITPKDRRTARFPIYPDPLSMTFEADDVFLLAMKGQDTLAALLDLRAAGVLSQPIFCFQNGVANEGMALRFFENVYGATVMLPADYKTPGEIAAYNVPRHGIFDIGRFPEGEDETVKALCAILSASGFVANARADVMSSKYRKLLANLRNIVDVAIGDTELQQHWYEKVRAEGENALRAAGIRWDPFDAMARGEMSLGVIAGQKRMGSSTMQSIVRGTGSLETDYLNGEIVLLGRLHNVATPANAAFCRLSQHLLDGRLAPEDADNERILSEIEPGSQG
ncbi:MAG: ketopantoate reductase family protein, partial [Rhizobiaceae bacterium]|nr:ketopantoate reductase family protein [Rhizobiaceae bacterium]